MGRDSYQPQKVYLTSDTMSQKIKGTIFIWGFKMGHHYPIFINLTHEHNNNQQ